MIRCTCVAFALHSRCARNLLPARAEAKGERDELSSASWFERCILPRGKNESRGRMGIGGLGCNENCHDKLSSKTSGWKRNKSVDAPNDELTATFFCAYLQPSSIPFGGIINERRNRCTRLQKDMRQLILPRTLQFSFWHIWDLILKVKFSFSFYLNLILS